MVPENVLDLPLEEAKSFWDVRASETSFDILGIEQQPDEDQPPRIWFFQSFLLLEDGSHQTVWFVDGEYRRMKLSSELQDQLEWAHLMGRRRIDKLDEALKETSLIQRLRLQ